MNICWKDLMVGVVLGILLCNGIVYAYKKYWTMR